MGAERGYLKSKTLSRNVSSFKLAFPVRGLWLIITLQPFNRGPFSRGGLADLPALSLSSVGRRERETVGRPPTCLFFAGYQLPFTAGRVFKKAKGIVYKSDTLIDNSIKYKSTYVFLNCGCFLI